MTITASDIQNQSFSIDRKGYDVDEVDVFLEHVASEIDELNATISQLESDLEHGEQPAVSLVAPAPSNEPQPVSQDELAKKDAQIASLEAQLEEKKANDYAIAQALITAQRSADDILANAHANAEHIRQEAEDEAQHIIDKAIQEKQEVIDEIEKLDDDREETRSEYQGILKDFISDASKKLSDISSAGIPAKSSHAKGAKSGDRVMPKNQAPIRTVTSPAPAYTTPAVASPSVVVPTTPTPSKVEKDLSGFGDTADSFEFGEID
ncbi:MAG: DivIVA domain-containing protein [Eggerthellaceae bacterium]|nr:DivIVA domain-containing protein [Eggerthellaceae bacterium]